MDGTGQGTAGSDGTEVRHGLRVLRLSAEGAQVASPADVRDLVGSAWSVDAEVVVVPVARLAPAFFDLRSGLAGDLLQSFAGYRLVLAVLGDTEEHQAASGALRDLVREHRSSHQAWFVPDEAALDERLRALAQRRGPV